MESVKVIIENWQDSIWYEKWTPIIIALTSLFVSLYSAYLTRFQLKKNSRPYVCALSYDNLQNGVITPRPSLVGYKVTNNPAKILKSKVGIKINNETLYSHLEENFVRYHITGTEWIFSIDSQQFNAIIQRHGNNPDLRRLIELVYSELNGGEKYHFSLIQKFESQANQWKDVESFGN